MRCQECKSRFFRLTIDQRLVCADCGTPVPDAPRRAIDVLRFTERAADIAAAVDRNGEDLEVLYTQMGGLTGDFAAVAEEIMVARTNASTLRNEISAIIKRLRDDYLGHGVVRGKEGK